MPTAWKILNSHPPCLIRLLARRKLTRTGKQVRAISAAEVAIASGLSLDRVLEISPLISWETVTVAEAERFVLGCGFDPLSSYDRNRKSAYQRSCQTSSRQQFSYLRKSPHWKTEFVPLISRLRSLKAS